MMSERLTLKVNPEVDRVFNNYPNTVKHKMLDLRELIVETAKGVDGIAVLEETLKWGEISYLTKNGSTIRINWNSKLPNQYAMYFQCTSRLVSVFRVLFKNTFNFDGKRAIIFSMTGRIPKEELKYCIKSALTYHKVKDLPTLGI